MAPFLLVIFIAADDDYWLQSEGVNIDRIEVFFLFAFSFLCCLSLFYDGNSANPILPSARQSENNRSRVRKTKSSSL